MALAHTHSFTLIGLDAHPVTIEADLSGGLPQFNLLGMPAQAAREARDRIRVAIQNLGGGFPSGRVTVQLTSSEPLEMPALADLAIAGAILAAMGRIPAQAVSGRVLLGQLALSGALLPLDQELAWIQGALQSDRPVVLPPLRAAAQLPGHGQRLGSVQTLSAFVAIACGHQRLAPLSLSGQPLRPHPIVARQGMGVAAGPHGLLSPDLWDEICGQAQAKRAAVAALAGGHHLLMMGPPGVGKSMIAQRMAALQPPLEQDQAQALAAIRALQGLQTDPRDCLAAPFRAPHHSASAAALFGGGRPFRPGEISLAHGGVLFLDELAEFRRDALEALREPLETGWVQPARLQSRVTMPARAQLVAAMNPCPCGLFGAVRAHGTPCRCSLRQVQTYRAKLSAPLLDRFDLVILMQPPAASRAALSAARGTPRGTEDRTLSGSDWSGRQAKQAIQSVRDLARERQTGLNAQLSEAQLRRLPIDKAALALFEQLHQRADWSRRALVGMLRVARTLADLAGQQAIDTASLAQAVELRRGLALTEETAEP